ncbi:polyunsaturated fatty acid 5-lipoxygenase-like [Ptychodera flava]|uniref:polyunsaturated fatty acid 5-lipoxygenase-like n=1 Tax=Ptychodera flava TaxID=63121 RepID=UPI00396A16DD
MGATLTALLPDFVIYIHTGDIKGGGTDANVHLTLYNEEDEKSREIVLKDPLGLNFESNQTDRFYIRNMRGFGGVAKIEIWRDTWLGDDWYVDSVIVEDWHTRERHPFPIHRWVTGDHFFVDKYDCILPRNEPNLTQRQEELDYNKREYVMGTAAHGLPIRVASLPKHEDFSYGHKMDVKTTLLKTFLRTKFIKWVSAVWQDLNDISNIYTDFFPKPQSFETWREDWHFASQRLQGCHPYAIQLCKDIPSNLGVTDEMMKTLLEDMTLEECIEQKRLFMVDHKTLVDIPRVTEDLVVCSPIALFFMNKDKVLMPVAIQLFQDAAPDNPVFLPTDPEYTWIAAKLFFNHADASIHQSAVHLGFTHMIVETMSLSVNRNLSPSHPLFRMVGPHLKYVMAINNSAVNILIAPGGWVDSVMSVGRDGMLEIISRQWRSWRLDVDGTLPTYLRDRGVDDPEVIRDFPFRDDALLIYNAIRNYVEEIVMAHYETPQELADDHELQDMARELTAMPPEGLGVKGVPGNGSFTSYADVIQVFTSIIFISTVGHTAANYNQYTEYACTPNYPMLLRGKPPTTKEPMTETDIMNHIPDKAMTLKVVAMVKVLSNQSEDILGNSVVTYQYDPIGVKAYKKFLRELKDVGRVIDERNLTRKRKYDFLHPCRVANSINV